MALPPYELKNGDGVTTNFTFSFPYLEQSHVKVFVDGVSSAYSWVSSQLIEITPAPGSGTGNVLVKRETDTVPSVDFADGSTLNEADLDTATLQSLYVAEESNYTASNLTITTNLAGQWDGDSKRLVSLANPTDVQDAATKAYVDTTVAPALAAQAASVAAQAAAEAAQTSAETAETNAETAETNAAASETAAGVSETNATASYDAFNDRYLGSKASDPTLDNDGDALIDGAMYWNTTDNNMYVYDLGGTAWVTVSNNSTSVAAAASASAASTSASNASTSETNAEAAKDAAVVAQAAAEAAQALSETAQTNAETAETNAAASAAAAAASAASITSGASVGLVLALGG